MSTPADVVLERLKMLDLADTLPNLSPGATISRQTLADVGAYVAPPAEPILPSVTANLPRITVDMRGVDGELPRNTIALADLEVRRVLGEGGMGRVLLAHQRSLGREIAIKTLKSGDDSPQLVNALLRESRLTGALEHPGIVPIHALGLDDAGVPLLVMKRIEGVSLQLLIDDSAHAAWQTVLSGGTDRIEASLRILMRICEALAYAHSRGVLHCDIKPENIMVGAYGEVYLCDWGVAVRREEFETSELAFAGTPVYMAPEMLLGEGLDERTDVFLLGATLHHLLTGQHRHQGKTMMQILESVALCNPVTYELHVPAELAELCNRSTSRDPAERPASAEAFRNAIVEYLRKRSATVLSQAAQERLIELETILAAIAPDIIPDDLAATYRQAAEARFGFGHALRIEPTLASARNGLDRTLEALFDLELRQRQIESAAALLEEMPQIPEALVQRLAVARSEAEARRAETERLQGIARDLDPSVDARSRTLGLTALTLCTFAIIAVSTRGEGIDKASNLDMIWFALTMSVCTAAVFWALRRQLMTTLFNRRMMAVIGTVCAGILLNRIIGWWTDQSVATILGNDILSMATLVTVVAFTIDKRMRLIVVWLLVIRLAMALRPDYSPRLFTLSGLGVTAIFIGMWVQSKEREVKTQG